MSVSTREKQLQQQMRKIINQGEKIRKHLVTLKAEVGEAGDLVEAPHVQIQEPLQLRQDHLQNKVSSSCAAHPILIANSEEGTDSGNVTEGSDAGEVEREKERVGGEVEEEGGAAAGESKEAAETTLKSEARRVVSREEGADVDDNDVRDLIEMLEKLHRINKVLESKEEQILTMKFECDVLTESNRGGETPNPTFNREVGEYRQVNAALLRDIADNSTLLRGLKEESEERKREVARLEFDVNLIERESKRLESDLRKVKSIGCGDLDQFSNVESVQSRHREGVPKSRNTFEATSQNKIYGTRSEVQVVEMYKSGDRPAGYRGAPTVAQPSNKPLIQMDQTLVRHNLANRDSPKTAPDLAVHPLQELPTNSSTADPLVDSPPNPSADDRASPPGSSRGSDKSVRFNEQENVLRFCSTASSSSLSPPPLLLPVLSPRSILKCVKGGYGSDSGSDTGVSSLSSMQGDFELSTLV